MPTREFKELLNLQVIANSEAKGVGKVHGVLFDPSANALYGLVITPVEKDGALLFLPLKGIHTIGKDAVTMADVDLLEPFEQNSEAQKISSAGGYLNGMNVMTESGETIGKINKVTINEDGTVASYHSTTGFMGTQHDIEPSEVVAGSKEMLIISDSAREGAPKNITS